MSENPSGSGNPAIHETPDGDVDVSLPADQATAQPGSDEQPGPEASVDEANLDHPEELMGE